MRTINLEQGLRGLSSSITGYLEQFEYEASELNKITKKEIYVEALAKLKKFKEKYPDIYAVESKINHELISPYSVEYCFKYGKYPEDASPTSIEFGTSLNEIFKMEDLLKKEALTYWKNNLSKLEDIENGGKFTVVGHASYLLPGLASCGNMRGGQYNKLYLSCSLLSDKELNTFNDNKTVYLVNVDESNYIASSADDSVTADFDYPSFETLKELDEDGHKHYIKVGYTHDPDKSVTTISTPELIERDSIKREVATAKEMYEYDSLTNEIVLDRTKTNCYGALLISNGYDILIDNYLILKQNNIPYKCINKSLYREQNGLVPYKDDALKKLLNNLLYVDEIIKKEYITKDDLKKYYEAVVIPMKYTKEVKELIDSRFSKYIDINKINLSQEAISKK